MARKKISEYLAKSLLYGAFHVPYAGVSINLQRDSLSKLDALDTSKKYVGKVDQGVKKRNKLGLVIVKKSINEIKEAIKEWKKQGFTQFLVEDFIVHKKEEEYYLAIERVREGHKINYSDKGGVDIEEHADLVKEKIISSKQDTKDISSFLKLDEKVLSTILEVLDNNFFSFLEINPLVVVGKQFYFLDSAVEVDSTAEFFVQNSWKADDFVGERGGKTQEEQNILDLKAKSQAAFKFDLLNSDGSIWMLLSGGGASIVLADEVYNLGEGENLANYGEYSGNPNQEETYIYTKNVLSLLLKSKAKKKVLIIGGGVANFTDVKATFRGVIRAMDDVKNELSKQGVKVFVRRGGPNQKTGLFLMKDFLQKSNLYGNVVGPDVMITNIIAEAVEFLC